MSKDKRWLADQVFGLCKTNPMFCNWEDAWDETDPSSWTKNGKTTTGTDVSLSVQFDKKNLVKKVIIQIPIPGNRWSFDQVLSHPDIKKWNLEAKIDRESGAMEDGVKEVIGDEPLPRRKQKTLGK